MKTKEQVESEFKSELKALLNKWNAEITIGEQTHLPYMRGENFIQVEINSIWNDTDQDREYTLIEFGSYIDGL